MQVGSHVARTACFQLVFAADIREYADIAEALWTAVQPRLVDNYSDANASIVIAYNEEYIVPNEYVELYVFFCESRDTSELYERCYVNVTQGSWESISRQKKFKEAKIHVGSGIGAAN